MRAETRRSPEICCLPMATDADEWTSDDEASSSPESEVKKINSMAISLLQTLVEKISPNMTFVARSGYVSFTCVVC